MANGSRHSMRYIAEVTYGVTPATPAFKPIRHNTTSLGLAKEALQSEELRGDRQIEVFRHGAFQVGGDIAFELSYGSFDDLLEACLCGTWVDKAFKTGSTISATASDNSYNDSANGFITAGFQVGDRIGVAGFTGNVANNIANGLITSVTAGKIIIGGTDGDVIVDDAAGETVTITSRADRLVAGVTRRSFTIERHFADITDKPYHRYTGCEINSLAMQINANAMVTGTFGVIGQNQTVNAAIVTGATYALASTSDVMDSFSGVLNEGGSPIAVITEIQLNLENGLEARYVVGSPATQLPSIGRSNVSGTITAYFENSTMLEKFINETESSIQIYLEDLLNNTYVLNLPRVKYNGGQPDVGGEGPITLAIPFQALRSSVYGSSIYIDRIPL